MELPILKNQTYDKFIYPIEKFEEVLLRNPTSFMISNNGFWHNGVHFNSYGAIKNICDGKIIAMRLSEQYEESGYFKDNKITPKELATLRGTAVYREKISDTSFSVSFDKYFIDKGKNFILKDGLSVYEKEDAKRLLNDIFSNNFVLIEHKEKNPHGTEITVYSLFSGLRPLHRLTNKEKSDLFFYDTTIMFTEGEYDCVPITNCTDASINSIPCETIVKILSTENGISNIEFYLNRIRYEAKIEDNKIRKNCQWEPKNHSEVKRFKANSTDDNYLSSVSKQNGIVVYSSDDSNSRTVVGVFKVNENIQIQNCLDLLKNGRISYLNSENKSVFGYINTDLKIDDKVSSDFLNAVTTGNIEKRLGIINLKISLKDGVTLGKVVCPSKKEILKNDIVGYSGFSVLEKQNDIVVQSEKYYSTIHFEMFTNDNNFITKDRNNNNLKGNFCYKTLIESTIYTGVLRTVTEEDTSVADQITEMSYIKIDSEFKLLDYERFYKVTVKANVQTFAAGRTINFSEAGFSGWNKDFKAWLVNTNSDIQLCDENGNVVENETIPLYRGFRYKKNMNYEKKDPPLRKLVYYYEKLDSEFSFYIKEKDFDSLQKEKLGGSMYILKQEIPANQRLKKPTATKWSQPPKTIVQNKYLFHEQRTMSEYDSTNPSKVKNHYQKIKLPTVDSINHVTKIEDAWINAREILGNPNLSGIQFSPSQSNMVNHFDYVNYDDWNSFFTEKDIKTIGTYKIENHTINKNAYESLGYTKNEANILIDALNFDSRIGISGSYQKFGAVIKKHGLNKKIDSSFFKNKTEWIKDSDYIEYLTTNSKSYKKAIEQQKDKLVFWGELEKSSAISKTQEKFFFNPFNFMNHLNLVVENHASALVRVQKRIVKMKTLQPGGPGIFDQGGRTFCNHAAFLTIRALDINYLDFTGRIEGSEDEKGVDKPIDQAPSTYKYKVTSYWCVILRNQAKNTKSGITEVFSNKEIISLANQGYVIIAAWENSAGKDASPHYATVIPQIYYGEDKKTLLVCNVGGFVEYGATLLDSFGEKKIPNIHFYYNINQNHRESYDFENFSASIEKLEKRDGVLNE